MKRQTDWMEKKVDMILFFPITLKGDKKDEKEWLKSLNSRNNSGLRKGYGYR